VKAREYGNRKVQQEKGEEIHDELHDYSGDKCLIVEGT
jgi:hypothetical protein